MFGQNILAVEQVFGIGHEGDGHDLAVDADQLAFLKILPPFRDVIIQRADQIGGQQRRDRVGRDHGDGVIGRVGGQCRHLDILVFGGLVLGHRHGRAGAGSGRIGDHAQRGEIVRQDAH